MKDDEVACSVYFLYFPEENKFKLWLVKRVKSHGEAFLLSEGKWLHWEISSAMRKKGTLYTSIDFPEIIQDRIALLMMNGEGKIKGVGLVERTFVNCEGTKGALCRIDVSLTPEEFTQIEEDYK